MALVPLDVGAHIFQELHQPRQTFHIGQSSIDILQSYSISGVAGCVWRSSVVLSKYFANNPSLVHDKTVIELGSGTGLLGIVCHKLGAKIISTDHKDYLSSSESNFLLNGIDPQVHCKALNWGSSIQLFLSENNLPKPEVIIGADIVYVQDTFDLLKKTLLDFSVTNRSCKIYLACQIRYDKDEQFIEDSKEHFFVEEISHSFDNNIRIICLTIDKPK